MKGSGEQRLPRHIAIIMDGNGRWAKKRFLPRAAGHKAGVKAVRKIVEFCADGGIEALTLFAFSSENWRRPRKEVSILMDLFLAMLNAETEKLHKNGIRIRLVGDQTAFSEKLQRKIVEAEQLTENNTGLNLLIAANYGGRWDILQAVRKIARRVEEGTYSALEITSNQLEKHLSFADLPEPDLFIRTGGEKRISNFILWQLAYTELYFTETLWPDFDEQSMEKAIQDFASRQRRFGYTSEQIESGSRLGELVP
ncbi:MAG: isoprenyl transferase [Methylococcales bacterium]